MKILLFGISNVGKMTLAKLLSIKMGYKFDDLDEEIKRIYGKIDRFQEKFPIDIERHKNGIYEIKFNDNLECIYFKSWEMEK